MHKIRYLSIGCIGIGCLIMLRLFYLQASITYYLHTRGQKNFLRITSVQPTRGTIVDCKGRLLATNRVVSNLCWVGSGQKIVPDITATVEKLASIIPLTIPDHNELMTAIKRVERTNGSLTLAHDLTFEQLSRIEELFPNDAHIRIVPHFKRLYPHATCACHILGYLGHLESSSSTATTIGRMGLEQICERTLRGQQGSIAKKINSFGKHVAQIELKRALAGHTIYTTLDIDIQNIAETTFPDHESGTIIVMDAKDGALQAVMSRPSFNPALFLDRIDHTQWNQMQENRPFLNRAFNACYPPGSLFKLVTVSAALEHNIIKQDALWYCNGYFSYHGRHYGCHLHTGHGQLSTCQALAHSCNILFYTIGKQIDIDLLAHYAHLFGLGSKTNLPFAQKEGLIPSRAWKRQVKGERWWQGETLSASIGQSFLLVTPIQVARMIGSIFTGYLVQPRLLQKDPIITTPLQLRAETIDFLQRSMKSVITGGTGQRANLKNITIHGKTSTAQTSLLQKRDKGKNYMEHAWFAAHVQYKTERPFVLVVLLENCGSSKVATQAAKNFLQQYKLLIDGHNQTDAACSDLAHQLPFVYEWTDASTEPSTGITPVQQPVTDIVDLHDAPEQPDHIDHEAPLENDSDNIIDKDDAALLYGPRAGEPN